MATIVTSTSAAASVGPVEPAETAHIDLNKFFQVDAVPIVACLHPPHVTEACAVTPTRIACMHACMQAVRRAPLALSPRSEHDARPGLHGDPHASPHHNPHTVDDSHTHNTLNDTPQVAPSHDHAPHTVAPPPAQHTPPEHAAQPPPRLVVPRLERRAYQFHAASDPLLAAFTALCAALAPQPWACAAFLDGPLSAGDTGIVVFVTDTAAAHSMLVPVCAESIPRRRVAVCAVPGLSHLVRHAMPGERPATRDVRAAVTQASFLSVGINTFEVPGRLACETPPPPQVGAGVHDAAPPASTLLYGCVFADGHVLHDHLALWSDCSDGYASNECRALGAGDSGSALLAVSLFGSRDLAGVYVGDVRCCACPPGVCVCHAAVLHVFTPAWAIDTD